MARRPASIRAELERLRERLEVAHGRIDVSERRLRSVLAELGRERREVSFCDVCRPAVGRENRAPRRTHSLDAEWWPRDRQPRPKPMEPTPGLSRLTQTGGGFPVIGFSVCGLPGDAVASIVASVADLQGGETTFVPVFLVDTFEIDVFRAYGYAFEYFPGPSARRRLDGSSSWKEYAARRRDLVIAKYGLQEVVTFGRDGFGEG